MSEQVIPSASATVLVLASASSGRAATLRRAGIEPLVRVAELDEDAVLAHWCGPDDDPGSATLAAQKVTALAQAKAQSVAAALDVTEVVSFANIHPPLLPERIDAANERRLRAIVVGCDSMLECDGRLLGKPHSPGLARERITAQSGKTVVLHTGHCVIEVSWELSGYPADSYCRSLRSLSRAASTQVHFGVLNTDEIDAYVATGEPLEVAGAFTIDGLGGAFIEGVSGDPHSVVGISLPLLRQLTGELGLPWASLWNRRA